MSASEADKHTDEELIAQMTCAVHCSLTNFTLLTLFIVRILILGGMDTTSNSLSRILHLLAENPDVQDKLRAEIAEASGGEDLAYDDIARLPYLEAVCRETMRLYSSAQFIARQ